jgi:hypothetical protein
MKRLLLALTVAVLLAIGLVAVFDPLAPTGEQPLPLLEPIPSVEAREVLVRAEESAGPMSAGQMSMRWSTTPATAQQCGYEPGSDAAELELTPAQGPAAASAPVAGVPRGLALRRHGQGEPPPSPEAILTNQTLSLEAPVRLPPLDDSQFRAIKLSRPRSREESRPPEEQPARVLIHAGGAIEAEIPAGWKVFEVSARRQVYAVLTPPETEQPSVADPCEGIWLSHIALPPRRPWSQKSLAEELLRRLSALPGKPQVIQTNPPTMLGPWEAHSVVYACNRADSEGSSQATEEDLLGGFMLVRTAWGLVEINAMAPRGAYQARQAIYQQWLRSVKLEAPSAPRALSPRTAGGGELLGSWKGSRTRLRLHGDARLELLFDSAQAIAIDPAADPDRRPIIRRLIGEFQLDQDVLHVRWDDGSQANYRWAVEESGELMLTDHEGRISRLSRLYE